MVLSGEGSDEIFGGYLYFHKAPNKEELHEETCRKVLLCSFLFFGLNTIIHTMQFVNYYYSSLALQIKALHLYDCLRANKSTSAWGLEARVPFLDKEFIDVAMSIDPKWKMVNSFEISYFDINFVILDGFRRCVRFLCLLSLLHLKWYFL